MPRLKESLGEGAHARGVQPLKDASVLVRNEKHQIDQKKSVEENDADDEPQSVKNNYSLMDLSAHSKLINLLAHDLQP